MPVTCDLCGRVHEDDVPPLTWSLSTENGLTTRCCDVCTREQLRAIEGKLPPGFW